MCYWCCQLWLCYWCCQLGLCYRCCQLGLCDRCCQLGLCNRCCQLGLCYWCCQLFYLIVGKDALYQRRPSLNSLDTFNMNFLRDCRIIKSSLQFANVSRVTNLNLGSSCISFFLLHMFKRLNVFCWHLRWHLDEAGCIIANLKIDEIMF